MLKARAQAAKANEQLQGLLGGINPSGATSAFERMEDKVLQLESRAQAAGELTGSDFESKFAVLEAGSDVDDELAALKAQISGSPAPQSLPPGQTTATSSAPVDDELEKLKKELEKM